MANLFLLELPAELNLAKLALKKPVLSGSPSLLKTSAFNLRDHRFLGVALDFVCLSIRGNSAVASVLAAGMTRCSHLLGIFFLCDFSNMSIWHSNKQR